jgi:hypothetical protein
MYIYRMCARTGQLVLLNMLKDFENPAFLRYHPEVGEELTRHEWQCRPCPGVVC